jgi:hypothetical protein
VSAKYFLLFNQNEALQAKNILDIDKLIPLLYKNKYENHTDKSKGICEAVRDTQELSQCNPSGKTDTIDLACHEDRAGDEWESACRNLTARHEGHCKERLADNMRGGS